MIITWMRTVCFLHVIFEGMSKECAHSPPMSRPKRRRKRSSLREVWSHSQGKHKYEIEVNWHYFWREFAFPEWVFCDKTGRRLMISLLWRQVNSKSTATDWPNELHLRRTHFPFSIHFCTGTSFIARRKWITILHLSALKTFHSELKWTPFPSLSSFQSNPPKS